MIWTAIISDGITTISKVIMTDTPCHSKAVKQLESMEFRAGMFIVGIIKGRHEIYT
tara:strand:+ start:27 stop:194 length:168 start_codon:yes stop_codon:yes gene_type:complete